MPWVFILKSGNFLGFEKELSQGVENVLLSPVVNARKSYALPAYDSWSGAPKNALSLLCGKRYGSIRVQLWAMKFMFG